MTEYRIHTGRGTVVVVDEQARDLVERAERATARETNRWQQNDSSEGHSLS